MVDSSGEIARCMYMLSPVVLPTVLQSWRDRSLVQTDTRSVSPTTMQSRWGKYLNDSHGVLVSISRSTSNVPARRHVSLRVATTPITRTSWIGENAAHAHC